MRKMKFHSEHPLSHIISALSTKNIELGKARNAFLLLKAEKDNFEANLVKFSPGESNAERVNNAKAKEEWLAFHIKLNRAEAEYEFIKLQFRILECEFQSQYLTLKLDDKAIRRGQE